MIDRLLSAVRRHPPAADLSARLDGALPAGRSDRIDAHLAGCDRCRQRFGELSAVRRLLSDLPPATAPRSFRLSPGAVRAPAAGPPRRPFPALQLASAVAAVVFALLLAGDLSTTLGGGGGASGRAPFTALQGGPASTGGQEKAAAGTPTDQQRSAAGPAAPVTPSGDMLLPGTSDGFAPTPGAGTPAAPAYAPNAAATAATPSPGADNELMVGPEASATPAPAATQPAMEPAAAPERLDKGRTALRSGEALAGLVALGSVGALVLRRRRRPR